MGTGGAWWERRGGACLVHRGLLVRPAYESRKVSTGKRGLGTHLGSAAEEEVDEEEELDWHRRSLMREKRRCLREEYAGTPRPLRTPPHYQLSPEGAGGALGTVITRSKVSDHGMDWHASGPFATLIDAASGGLTQPLWLQLMVMAL